MNQENDDQKQIEVKETEIVKGRVTFAPKGPTPTWAIWIFRSEFVMSKVLSFYFTGTDRIPMSEIKELMLIITAIDLGTWLFANSLGVKKKDLGLPDQE